MDTGYNKIPESLFFLIHCLILSIALWLLDEMSLEKFSHCIKIDTLTPKKFNLKACIKAPLGTYLKGLEDFLLMEISADAHWTA